MKMKEKPDSTTAIASCKILALVLLTALTVSWGVAQGDNGKSSIILSKEKLKSLKNILQVKYQDIGWRIVNISQPLATEIFVSIEVDDRTASIYSDPNGNRVIFGHSLMCPNLDEPRWKFIDKNTDVLLLMFYKGNMIFPHDLHRNRQVAGCRFSRSYVKSMIEQGAIQVEIHKKGK
jgi:hypothetical protein